MDVSATKQPSYMQLKPHLNITKRTNVTSKPLALSPLLPVRLEVLVYVIAFSIVRVVKTEFVVENSTLVQIRRFVRKHFGNRARGVVGLERCYFLEIE